jgi:arylsulfatase A-like enzyme
MLARAAPLLPLLLLSCTSTSTSTSTTASRQPSTTASRQPSTSTTPHPNILVLVPDSLRADRVHASGLPGFTALEERGCRFDQAISQSGWTLPALATMLNGHYPLLPVHNQARMAWMDQQLRTVPEILGLYGYHSVAWWGGNLGSMAPEFSRGFTELRGDERGDPIRGDRADVLAWLHDEPPQPFFAFVHDVDLQFVTTRDELEQRWPGAGEHVPVKPGKEFWTGVGLDELHSALEAQRGAEQADALVVEAYDAVVNAYDRRVTDTLAALEAAGLDDDTVVVLISPHGIHLGEGGSFRHGTLDEADLRIPFIVAPPGQRSCTRRELVQTLDLAPTLLALAGVPLDETMSGRSLEPLLDTQAHAWPTTEVLSMNSRVELSLRSATHKIELRQGRRPPAPPRELRALDLRQQPPRPADIAQDPALQAMAQRLEAAHREHAGPAAGPDQRAQPADGLRQVLQDRGYWEHVADDGGPKPGPGAGAPARDAASAPQREPAHAP